MLETKPDTRKPLKTTQKMRGQSLQILGVGVDSSSMDEVLSFVAGKLAGKEKFWIVTPNPEFLTAAWEDKEFKAVLNQADLAIPDGIGLVLASRILKTKPLIRKRVAGSDVVEQILQLAPRKRWKIGVVGARKKDEMERKELIKRLRRKYKGLKIETLEETSNWQEKNYDIIFACQGMKAQEKWILQNRFKTRAFVFMGIGGSLDFFAGFARRAPIVVRKMKLEWLWRLFTQPWRWRRQLNLLKFAWLVLKEAF